MMVEALPRALSAALILAISACEQPFTPRAGIATQDDPTTDAFVAVSAGREHTCALTADGSAYCWGSNEFAQLGATSDSAPCFREDRPIACRRSPVAVTGALKFQRIRAGGSHTCAIALDFRVHCWGDNLFGELGDPAVRNSAVPIAVSSGDTFIDLAVGGAHTCGLRTDGVVLCWGANAHGQLGIGTVGNGSAIPTPIQLPQRFSTVAAGENRTCGRILDGTAFCWGATWVGRQDDTEVFRPQSQASRIQGRAFQTVAVGTNTTCGVAVDNHGFCWEANPTGAFGDGTTTGSSTPQPVGGSLDLVSISVGALQTCAIAATGLAYCWGANDLGQLGVPPALIGTRCGRVLVTCSKLPMRVSGWRLFSQITAGQGDHVCGLTIGGSVYCWGAGSLGQRGDGRTSSEWSPTRVRSPLD